MSETATPAVQHPVILIDASGWLFRAFHALPPLTTSKGEPTGAIYGMGMMLRRLVREYAPQRIAVVFDAPGVSFRSEIYADYKANRDETPAELSNQFAGVVELVEAMGLPILAVAGVEADDVIGTLTIQARAAGHPVLIVTSDKDMAQLVDDQVALLDTMKSRRMDPAGVEEKFGVPPHCIVDYLALIGDTSDNIPGVPSVGPKTAAKWLKEYGSLDAIVEASAAIGGRVGEKLREHLHQLPMAKDLATIRCDLALPVALDTLVAGPPQREKLAGLYRRYEFTRLLAELGDEPGGAPLATSTDAAPGEPSIGSSAGPSAGPSAEASPATWVTTVLDEAALADLIASLEAAPLISLDTETDNIDPMLANLVGVCFATEPGAGWYLPLRHDYMGAPAQLPFQPTLERLRPILEDAGKPKLAQHAKYDCNVLRRHGIVVAGLAYDTMLESYVLDAVSNRHDMDTLAEKHLGHHTIHFEDVAGKGKNQLTFNQVPLETAAPYAAEDADITLRLHQKLYPEVQAIPALARVLHEIEMPLVPVLAKMEYAGVRVDGPLLVTISAELAGRMEDIEKQCWEVAGTRFNLGSPKQLQTILYEELKLPCLGRTPKGEPSTAEDVLEQLAAEHPLPRLILDWRGMSKLRSTYADNLPKQINPHTGRIHTSYHQAVAATGRLSSSNPNLQNIPVRTAEGRRIREAFIADPGNALLAIDYSQIELRLMAHFSGDAGMQRAFHEGLDIHQATAAEVFGTPLDAVQSAQRRAAKAINFGLIYGISSFGLARQLGIGRNEAQQYIDLFFSRYPGVRRFMDETRLKAREQGYVETLFGRRLYLPNITARNAALRQYAERTAINAPLQGTAADLIKMAMIDIDAWLAREAPGIRMTMQVHDELIFEGDPVALEHRAPEIVARMCRVATLAVPLIAEPGIGANWNVARESELVVAQAGS